MPEAERARILLVGASGRVGRMVLHHWQRDPGDTDITPQYRGKASLDGLSWEPMEGAAPLCKAVHQVGGFHAMVVLAGTTPGSGQDLNLNTRVAQACLEAAAQAGIGRVLLASSSAVYGAGQGMALDEQARCDPVNDYGAAKLTMERDCAHFRQVGMDLCVLRIGNVAGADALLLNIAKADPAQTVEIDIYEDGRGPVRSYIGTATMAKVLQALCLHPDTLPPVLNLASPVPVSMDQLAKASGHPWTARKPSASAHQNIILDCKALSALYDFPPSASDPSEMVRQWKATLSS